MKTSIRMMILLIALTGALNFVANAQTYNWKPVRMGGGGNVTSIKAHPKVPNLYFITTDVGTPYRWNHATQKWEDLMWYGKIPTTYWNWEAAAKCGDLAFDPGDVTGNILYATHQTGKGTVPGGGTSPGTVLKSVDRGATWTDCQLPITVLPNSDQTFSDRLAVDPNNSNVVYVTTRANGTYKSTAAGAVGSWTKVNTSLPDDLPGRFIFFDKSGGVIDGATKNIFLGSRDGVYRSTDGGNSFALMPGSPVRPRRASISNDGTFFVTQTLRDYNVKEEGTTVNKWNGSSWVNITPVTGKEFSGVGVNPANSNEIIVTTTGSWNHDVAYRSTTGGSGGSWSSMVPATRDATEAPHSGGDGANGNIGHNVNGFAWDPFSAGQVWFSDMLDVGQTTNVWDSRVTWKLRNNGLEEIVVAGPLVAPPSGSNYLVSTTGDVGGFDHKSLDTPPAKGISSSFITNTGCNTSGGAIQYNDPNFIARVGSDGWNGTAIGGYSTNGGTSYTKFATLPGARGRIAVSATSRKMVWVTQGGLTYQSSNLGTNWTACVGVPTGVLKAGSIYDIWAGMQPLAADKVNGNIFYIYAAGKVYVSTDGGVSFAAAASNLPNVGNVAQMNVETTPGKEGDLWISFSGDGLFHSTDTAKTFTKVNPSVITRPKWVAVGKADTTASSNPVIYVSSEGTAINGVSYGVFRSDDNGGSWTTIANPVPGIVSNMAADLHGRVYLGIGGNGIFVGEPSGGPVVSVAVAPAVDSVIVGFTKQLKATLTPAYPTNNAVSWSSSDTNIATVSSTGLVTGVSAGLSTIMVTTQDGGKTAQSSIKVTPVIPVTSVMLDSTTLVGLGVSKNLVATVFPVNATYKSVSWTSSDTTIAKINESGLVAGLNLGTATITVTTADGGKTAATLLTVGTNIRANNCGGPTISNFVADTPQSASMWTSGTQTAQNLTGLVNPAPENVYKTQRNSGTTLQYSYGNLIPNAVYKVRLHFSEISETITSGKRKFNVTGNSVADTLLKNFDIFAQAGGRHKPIIKEFNIRSTVSGLINLTFRPIANMNYPAINAIEVGLTPLTSVGVNPSTAFVGVGDTTRLAAMVLPANATNQKVTWTSSNTSTVSVDGSGLLRGVSPGTAVITATTDEGRKTASSTVTAANIAVTGVTIPSTGSVGVNNSVTLAATIQPANATNKTLIWSTSNAGIVSVNQSGVVTGVAPGDATITVTTQDGAKTASSVISASNVLLASVVLSKTNATVGVGDTTSIKATVAPLNASNKTVVWNSSDPSVATVNSSGIVTAVAIGTATVTATAQDASGLSSGSAITVISAGACGIMTNNGFESSFVNWIRNPNVSVAKIGTSARSGLKSAVITADQGAINYGKAIPVTGGSEITFDVWAKVEGTPNPSNASQLILPWWAGIGIDFYDSQGAKITSGTTQFQVHPSTPAATATVYTKYTVTKLAPANAATIGIWASKAGPSGQLVVDDFCLTIAAPPQIAQTVSLDSLAPKTVGDISFDPGAVASSGLPVSYSSSDTTVAVISNGKIQVIAPGTTVITASQNGNETYSAAPASSRTLKVSSGLKVLYKDGDNGQVDNNTIKPYLTISNESSVAVPYSELTARYWVTAENYAGINKWIDYAEIGNNKVTINYVALDKPRQGALGYVEYQFNASAGSLNAGGNSGVIQSRFANVNWENLAETDDYSFKSSSSYTANDHITLYRNGKLWWGTEPDTAAAVLDLKVYSENKNTNASPTSLSTWLKIENKGNVPVDYADLSIRYWFTADGTASLNYWIDFAKLAAGNISGQFTGGQQLVNADTYFELKAAASLGKLYPLSNTGNIQYRIGKTDWSAFDDTNDHSYKAAGTFAENNKITIYYKGQLVYGQEPATQVNARLGLPEIETTSDGLNVTVLGNPVTTDHANIIVSGANASPVRILVADLKGRVLFQKLVDKPVENEQHTLPLGKNSGLYLIKVGTSKETLSLKIVKP
ncbi:Ig-like domain-containing protein [Dyadobacter psychrotolerans]|uniref:T9SS type A sorting domain-containing protein n=1 Tax=Dyadobacter psychrotolerans TaxID=2541721 RepID=A0A4R5DYX1_9BACT|nr:Ig-like domain-containing protein [Dyadobacter psychrotolerans]TDE17361.1 T9SS type A sorting domain-containing protein [Dyadobacter psychrotolerans]